MGLFEKLGREVETFKQNMESSADEADTYRCENCEATFTVAYAECPDCGAEAVAAVDDESA
ncbi:MAG: hypothetical protein ABEH35_02315 [Haloarculaceae archaeon]